MRYINSLSQTYLCMAQNSYSEFELCLTNNDPDSRIKAEELAIQTIVFLSLSIEAYINLFGVYHFGENTFRTTIDSKVTKKGKEYHPSPLSKLQTMSDMMGSEYPKDHLDKLKQLFELRNALVHQIPTICNLERETFSSRDYATIKVFKDSIEKNVLFDHLDEKLKLYFELEENLRVIASDEMNLNSTITRELVQSIDTVFIDVINDAIEQGVSLQ